MCDVNLLRAQSPPAAMSVIIPCVPPPLRILGEVHQRHFVILSPRFLRGGALRLGPPLSAVLLFLLRCAAPGCDLRAGLHDASALDSFSSVVPFLVGLGGGLFHRRFLLCCRARSLAGFLL